MPTPSHSANSTLPNSHQSKPQAFLTGSNQCRVHRKHDQSWYPDSWATNHVTYNPNNLLDSISIPRTDQVLLGNGQGLSIFSIGGIHFTSPHQPHTTLALNNLLLVRGITKNLMSVSHFAQDNPVYFEFHLDFSVVKSQATYEVLLWGTLGQDGLYSFGNLITFSSSPTSFAIFTSLPTVNSASLNTTSCLTTLLSHVTTHTSNSTPTSQLGPTRYTMWHYRLGHPHHEASKATLSHCKIPVPNKTVDDFCSACYLGKVHWLPSHASTIVYSVPFELILGDLWGPLLWFLHVIISIC